MTRRILAALAALVIALAGLFGVVSYARAADQRALAGQEAVPAYIAEKEVPVGTTAGQAQKDGLIVRTLVARKAVPEGALTEISGGYDQLVATATIQPGELVMSSRFAARGATAGTLAVPQGLMAVSVALDDPSHVGPFVGVGTKIAVFDTFNVQENGGKAVTDPEAAVPAGDRLQDRHEFTRATRLLVPELEVLAVGSTTTAGRTGTAGAEDTGSSPALAATGQDAQTLFTLAVTQEQANKLIHASRTGTLSFALLGPGASAQPGQDVNDHTLFEVTK